MATEAVALEPFMKVDLWDSVRLCTEMVELTGSDATASEADASVLAAVPVPEGSLMPVDEFASRTPGVEGEPNIGSSPRVMVRIVCRDSRIRDVSRAIYKLDPSTREKSVFVWVFRVTSPDGEVLDYRFRARWGGEASQEAGSGPVVVNLFLDVLDRRPMVTRPQASLAERVPCEACGRVG